MKKLHLLILRSFFGPFILIFFIVLFVLLMQFLWRYIDELVGKGLDFKTIAEFLMYTSATLVPMALPLSILMSSLMTFGNLGERYELSAIKASGISLQRILTPLFFIVLLISFGAFFFANNVLPFANLQMRSLLYDIRQQRPDLKLKPGEFNNLVDGYSMRIGDKSTKSSTLQHIQIYDHTQNKGNTSVTIADSGLMKITQDEKYVILTLFNGHSYNELQDQRTPLQKRSFPHRYDAFGEEKIIIELNGYNMQRTDQSLFKGHYAMMNLDQLEHVKDSMDDDITLKQDHVNNMLVKNNLFKKKKNVYQSSDPYSNMEPDLGLRPNRDRVFPQHPDSITVPTISPQQLFQQVQPNEPVKEVQKPHKTFTARTAQQIQRIFKKSPVTQISEKPKDIDSTKYAPGYVNTDSLFNILTLREKTRISSSALSYARSSKNVVENSLQAVDYKIRTLRRYEIEWHRKFTIAFACIVFLFIGAPLGAIIRKGGLGLPLVLSVLFFIFYYILSLTGEKMVRESILPSPVGMWVSSGVFMVAGIFLTYKATTDSSMLNLDTYLNFLKKIFGQRYNVVDQLSILTPPESAEQVKIHSLNNSLNSLEQDAASLITSLKSKLYFSDILIDIYAPETDTNLIMFDRYYNTTFRTIINHPIFHEKNIRAKVYEFPAFNYKEFEDEGFKMVIKVILACIPPIIVVIFVRHLVKQYLLNSKLEQIKTLIPQLISIINLTNKEL